jgi:hypothetical protein
MANLSLPSNLGEHLAQIYQILKRHETILIKLTLDLEAMKGESNSAESETFQKVREKARDEVARQAPLYDALIERSRRFVNVAW